MTRKRTLRPAPKVILTATQLAYLRTVNEHPRRKAEDITAWWHYLWAASYIDTIGGSVYITDKGREAVDKSKDGENRTQ